MSNTILSLHPFYEFGGIISLTTFFIRNQTTLRSALLTAHIFYIAHVIAEEGTIDVESVVWNVLNLSFNLYVLVGLMRERKALRVIAECRKSFARRRDLTMGKLVNVTALYARLQAGGRTATTVERPVSDKLFF